MGLNYDQYHFLRNGGETGEKMRQLDWSKTSVGTPDNWPNALRVTVSILLNSQLPMMLLWGDDYVQFHNDAYLPVFDNEDKHPAALGKRLADCPENTRRISEHLLHQVRKGGDAVWKEDQTVPVYKNGITETTYLTFCYSAVPDDNGNMGGVLCTCFDTTEKVESLARLKENTDELGFAIDATELGTWDLDPVAGKFKANTRLKSWFGLKPEDEIPLNLAIELIADEDRERVSGEINNALEYASGGRYQTTYTIINPATAYRRTVLAKGRAWFGEDQQAYRFNGTLQDITETKAAELAQREAEARFRNVSNTSPTGLWLSDTEGGLTFLNKTLVEWTGMPYEALLGAGWTNAIIEEDRQRAIDSFLTAVATKTHYDVEFRIKKFDDSIVWCRAAGDPFYDDDGRYAGYAGFCMDIQTQKEINNHLAESRRILFNSFEEAPVGIAIIDKQELTFTLANKFYARLVGRKQVELIGKPLLEALPELKGQGFDQLLLDVLRTGIPFTSGEAPVDIVYEGGMETIFVDLVYQPLYDTEGSIISILVVATDITLQVRSRRATEESEAKFRSLVEEAPVATCLFVGRDMTVEVANDIMLGYWGKDKSVIGLPLSEAVPELVGQPFLKILDDVYTTGEPYSDLGAAAQLNVSGELSTFYFDFTYKPLRNLYGQIYGVMDMAVDVTHQVISRKKLEAAEALLRDAVELAELATWNVDVINKTVRYSQRMQNWLGIEGATLETERSPRIHEKDRERIGKAVAEALKPDHSGIFDETYTIVHMTTGQERIIHASGRTSFDAEGKPLTLAGTAQDVTLQLKAQLALEAQVSQRTQELANMNEVLRRSNDELSQYAYVASHDLQEPLRKIRVFSGMLKSQTDIASNGRGFLDKIDQSAERMALLIRDLLDFSRLNGTAQITTKVDLNRVLQNVKNDFELLVNDTHATVDIGELPVIEAVSVQMNQLFYNLISNALKFRKPSAPPHISVTSATLNFEEAKQHLKLADPDNTYYRISVSDNGIGFEEKYSEQIFEVFKRLHKTQEYPGSGIGLAMCHRIAVNHGGTMYADSNPGEGATFHVILSGDSKIK